MSFFIDKWIVGRINQKELILIKKSNRNIFIERLSQHIKSNREVLTTKVLEEYDVALVSSDIIYILYQNIEGHLILNIINDNENKEICLTSTGLSEVYNLSLGVKDKSIHILYTIKDPNKDSKYIIIHHYYDGNIWREYIVDEINVNRIINPMKAIISEEKVSLVYYSNDNEISLKIFNVEELQWSLPTKLIEGDSEKLFLDMLIIDNNIHLTFCEYIDGNLVVKYIRFNEEYEIYNKITEEFISNEGSPSHPTLIYFKNELWVVWLELDKLFSRSSQDNGNNWGQIYMWNETKNMDFVRYKYVTTTQEDNIYLDYSFGSIYPDIRFLGFGPTDNAVEIPLKKKIKMKFPRI